jgi:DNA-binding winged helix-turn-helix (wHTH) protein
MIYCIGACTIDTQTYEVRLGGRPTSVEPQVFDLLLLLVTNRHRVVTKDEIIKQIWNGRIVSEDTLSSRIRAARKAIGDDGKAQRLIQTIQRRGFRFVGSVATQQEESIPKVARAIGGLQSDSVQGFDPPIKDRRSGIAGRPTACVSPTRGRAMVLRW